MKKLQLLLCLLSIAALLSTARADVSPTNEVAGAPDTSASASEAAPQPVDPAKAAEIRKLLELSGTVKITRQVMDQMISNFRTQNSTISNEFWDRFEKEVNLDELIDKLVPVYAKYYSLDDLKTLNAFYETPAGQRLLAMTPVVMRESMQIGQDWGRNIARRLMAELEEEKKKQSATQPAQ